MHNKYATFVLPVLAGLAIVGAGFSTWVFGNYSSTSQNATGTAIITGDESNGPTVSLKLGYIAGETFNEVSAPSFSLQLDQGSVSSATNPNAGITFSWNGADASKLDEYGLSFQWSIPSGDATAYSNYSVTVSYTVTLTDVDDGKILSYVKLDDSISLQTEKKNIATDKEVSSLTVGDGISYINENVGLKPTSWVYTNKPGNLEDYKSMLSNLGLDYQSSAASYASSQKIAFVFSVETTFTLNK